MFKIDVERVKGRLTEVINDLQTEQLRTATLDEPKDRSLALCSLGIPGEAAEVADLIKKFFFHGRPFDREKLVEELGDVTWYLSYMAYALEIPLAEFVLEPAAKMLDVTRLPRQEKFIRLSSNLCFTAGRIALFLDDLAYEKTGLIEPTDLKQEVARLIFYLGLIAEQAGATYIDLVRANIAKLEKRYPDGFNTADSLARKDEAKQSRNR